MQDYKFVMDSSFRWNDKEVDVGNSKANARVTDTLARGIARR